MIDTTKDVPNVAQRLAMLAEGLSESAIRRATVDGHLQPIRRGAYIATDEVRAVPQWNRHLLLVTATAPKLGSGAVISHGSAAALHGLALWPLPSARVHVSRNGTGGGGRRTRTLHLHVAPLTSAEVVSVRGISATSVARTIVDLARTESFEAGVVTADHALHAGLVDKQSLADVLGGQATLFGSRRAGAVLAFADGSSESVGESRSRVAMLRAGLPTPTLQHAVHAGDGKFIGRADFAYVEHRIAGEFDGRTKYGLGFADGMEPADVIVAERRRADAMERAGWIVVRWMWDDLAAPSILARKFHAALALRTRRE